MNFFAAAFISLNVSSASAEDFNRYPAEAGSWETPESMPVWASATPPTGYTESSPITILADTVEKLNDARDYEKGAAEYIVLLKTLNSADKKQDRRLDTERAVALTRYGQELSKARTIYQEAVPVLEALVDEMGNAPENDDDSTFSELEALVTEVETEHSQINAGCWLTQEADCAGANPDQLALLEEIQDLSALLDGNNNDNLNPAELLSTTRLLRTRVDLALRIARVAGVQLLVEGQTIRDGDGKIKRLDVPVSMGSAKSSTRSRGGLASPYSDKE